MTFIGLDPGKCGGIAAVASDGSLVMVEKMPLTERDILDLLAEFTDARAVLERVGPSPQMGRVSVWTFGVGYGGLRMALVASRIPFDEVTPSKWQQLLTCRSGGDKNVTKRRAQELFPSVKVTHAVADALLLAEYGRRTAVRP
jgi:hypothetical protein